MTRLNDMTRLRDGPQFVTCISDDVNVRCRKWHFQTWHRCIRFESFAIDVPASYAPGALSTGALPPACCAYNDNSHFLLVVYSDQALRRHE